MLKSLDIENIAVIEKANIEFSKGLSVLTGETGAGKSIIVDSINAVLGERTSKEMVRHGAQNASVSAVFEDIGDEIREKLEELGIDAEEDSLIIHRRISVQGKSSCRMNGVPCTVSSLREVGNLLVNIHGQHDSQELLNPDLHFKYVDMMGVKGLAEYKAAFRRLLSIRRRLKELTKSADDKERQLELLNYEISELEAADIKVGERDALKARRALIMNAQNVLNSLGSIISAFNGDEEAQGISTLLSSAQRESENIAPVDDELKALNDRILDLADQAEAVKDAAERKLDSVEFSEAEQERIEERLDLYYRFSAKYGATEEDMLSYLENAVQKRNSIVNSDEELEKLNLLYDEALEDTVAKAEALSKSRREAAIRLETAVKKELQFLDMPKIEFVTDFQKGNLSSTGFDKIEFLISTNPGEPPKPLSKIASGGELSRIMLAMKKVLAEKDSVSTLVFDEVDTGVSGKASRKIGYSLRDVSKFTQVLCVTHSAQIASCADTHFLISKQFKNNNTYTSVKPLNYEERKQELARIMGGMNITDALLQSAEELLNGN